MRTLGSESRPSSARLRKIPFTLLKATWPLAFLALLLPAFTARAQYSASLRGTVTDQKGAVVPGATLTLEDKGTGEKHEATSDDNGIYTFNALPGDHFQLTVERSGFKKKEIAEVALLPDQPANLDVQLLVGDVQETVTVNGSSEPLLNTDSATQSATISSEQVQHMPSYNRDVFQLAQLTPGVFGDGSQSGGGGSATTPGNQGPGGSGSSSAGIFQTENGPQIQTKGGQYETNGVSIDGISTTSAVWGGTSIITPSEDSVESLTVVANDYDAETGRFAGAQIEVTSKGGSNTIHGSAFFKVDRPGLNAYQRWNGEGSNVSGTAAQRGVNRDDSRYNNYGASLGGPLWKNKLFAFFNFEASPFSSSSTGQGWYDTSQFDSLTGLAPIASSILTYKGEGVASGSTVIARSCDQIGLTEGVNCNTESGGLNLGSPLTTGVGNQDLTYGGSSGTPGVGSGLGTTPDLAFFNTVNPNTVSAIQWNGRVDGDVTQKDHLTGTLYWVPYSTTAYNGPDRTANLWHHAQINNAFALIWNHTFSPTLLNEARANAAGWRWNELNTNPQAPFGLTIGNIDSIGQASPESLGAVSPSLLDQWTFDYKDTLTKVKGRHNIKAGGDVTRLYYLSDAPWASIPSYNFHNLWDFANDAPYNQGGAFFNATTGTPSMERLDERTSVSGFFVQDDYKMRPNLTLNVGLRWSYYGGFYSKENNLGVVQFGSGSSALTGMSIRLGGNLQSSQKTNWGPVVGFSWSPTRMQDKLVVRGGFGIGYNQDEIAITANGWANPPNGTQPGFNCAYSTFATNPTCAGNGILYGTSSSATNINGYPSNSAAQTTFNSANLPKTGTTTVTAFPSNLKTIANYHYSLEGDYQFSKNMVATLGYVGSETRNLIIQNQWNAVAAAEGIPLNPAVTGVDFYGNLGSGGYNAMIATLKHTFSQQFQADVQYTFSKATDDGSGPYEEDPYPNNLSAAHGPSDYDVRNAFKLFGIWSPVIFHGNDMLEKFAGGWTLGGILNWHSGFPWGPVYNVVGGNLYCSTCGYGQIRPAQNMGGFGKNTSNRVFEGFGAVNPNFNGNGTTFFKGPTYTIPGAFPAAAAPPQAGIQRNGLPGPHYSDTDMSLTKLFGLPKTKYLGEGAGLSFRVDAYDLFNQTNINGGQQAAGGGGGIDNVLGTVNPDGTINSVNSDFGVSNSALGSRTVQFQTRFTF
ncbi:MAG: TonB-dependent receptor [Terracidiphilus sp.]